MWVDPNSRWYNLSGKLEGMNPSYHVGISGNTPVVKVPPLTAILVKLS